MAMTECGHGHIYDSNIYTSCPYCNGSQSVFHFQPTQAGGERQRAAYEQSRTAPLRDGFGPSRPGDGFTSQQSSGNPCNTAPQHGQTMPDGNIERNVCGANPTQPPRGYRPQRRADEEQKTVGDMAQHLGMEPVVGWLVCIGGRDKGKDYHLWGRINTIGRSDRNDICIPNDLTISRENHARLGYDPKHNSFRLIPATNSNNIYLNGDVVDIPRPLHAFDMIEFGQTTLLFVPLCCERFSWERGLRREGEI